MADATATVDVLVRLKVGNLANDWVNSVWEHDFTEVDPLPLDIEEELQEQRYHGATLRALQSKLKPWVLGQENEDGPGFWTLLVEQEISQRNLNALLFYLMETGQKRTASAEQREAGIRAASIYMFLVAVPGSRAFKVFHPLLFQKAVAAFKCWSTLEESSPAPANKKRKAASPKGGRRGKRRRQVEEDWDDSEEEEEEDGGSFSAGEMRSLYDALRELLRDFVLFLDRYTLSDSGESAHQAMATLGVLIKKDPLSFEAGFNSSLPVHLMTSIPQLAYRGLALLCAKHGHITTMTTACFKQVLPSILMLIGDNKGVAASSIPRALLATKENAVRFVEYLMDTHGNQVLASVRILLQHICTQVPDKTEYRAKVSEAAVHLMARLPTTAYGRMIEWLYKYSRNSKIGYRVFALDLVCLLLGEGEREPTEGFPPELTIFLSHRFLLQMMLSRCSDNASTVRARAIQGFSHCSSSTDPAIKKAILEMVTPQTHPLPRTRLIRTPESQRTTPLAQPAAESSSTGEMTDNTLEAASTLEKTADGTPKDGTTEDGTLSDGTAKDGTPTDGTPKDGTATDGTPKDGAPTDGTPKDGTPTAQQPTPLASVYVTPGGEISLSDGKGMASMLRRRASDEKVNVRKAALQALENVIRIDGNNFNKEDLAVLHERCQDPALSVRKQALQCLTDLLLDFPNIMELQKVWLDAVLPMVIDRETTAQDKCLEMLDSILLGNIVPYPRSTDECHKLTWKLLEIMAGNHGSELRRFFQKACQIWGRTGKIRPTLVAYLQTHIGTENNVAVWMVLAELTPFVKKMNPGFVIEYWTDQASKAPDAEYQTVQRVLIVINHLAKFISQEERQLLSDDLKGRLMRFDSTASLITVTVDCLHKLCQTEEGDVAATQAKTQDWFADLLKACDSYLSEVILAENEDSTIEEDRLVRYLFTLGEIAQLCPARTPKRVFMLVQSLVAAPVITTVDGSTQVPRGRTTSETFGAQTTGEPIAVDSEAGEIPSSQNSRNSQEFQMSQGSQVSQPGSGSSQFSQFSQEAFSQFRGSRMSNKIRAHAFVTLGKLCLQNEDIAKKCIAALARELEIAFDPAIRNNVVIVMCDLCVRYTSLVDRYVSNVAACLKDESALVRKQTLILLTHLLQEDFLKWKGSLFFRFVTTVVDVDPEIKAFAKFCLVHQLMQRHPTMFFHHFLECVFHFNSYDGHSMYNKFSQTEREKKMFSLKGQINVKKRQFIYCMMLEHMTDEHRFQLTAKVVQEVLGGVVDGIIPLDSDTSALLQDALAILCSKEIKLVSMRTRNHDDIVEEQDMAQAVMQAAKKTIITQVVKKNVIENIVPIVISLKHMLEKHHSPILRDLMFYLRELMKDYKAEVKDIMSADRQLATEIEFDLRKFEEEQEAAQQQPLPPPRQTPQRTPQRTPRPGRPSARNSPKPSPFLSPRLGRAVSPHTPGGPKPGLSPRQLPPVLNIAQKLNTPARSTSLSTLAIMNSARKAIETARRVSNANSNSMGTPAQKKKVGWADEHHGSLTSPEESNASGESTEQFKTPKATKQKKINTPDRRAVSTPAVNMSVLGNVTFGAGEQNLSILPPSPIPSSLPLRMYGRRSSESQGTPSWTAQTEEEKATSKGKKEVVHMFSPDHPAPKPRKWNVKTPAPVLRLAEDSESDESAAKDSPKPLQEKQPKISENNKENGRKTLQARRSKDKSSLPEADKETNTSRRRSSRGQIKEEESEPQMPPPRRTRRSVGENEDDKTVTPVRRSGRQSATGSTGKKKPNGKSVDAGDASDDDTFVTITPRRSGRKAKK